MIERKKAHDLLMQNKSHYLWNKSFKKWTEEDVENLLQGKNPKQYKKPVGNKVSKQAVEMILSTGEKKEFVSAAAASRKTGININSIYAVVNGRRPSIKKVKFVKIN